MPRDSAAAGRRSRRGGHQRAGEDQLDAEADAGRKRAKVVDETEDRDDRGRGQRDEHRRWRHAGRDEHHAGGEHGSDDADPPEARLGRRVGTPVVGTVEQGAAAREVPDDADEKRRGERTDDQDEHLDHCV